MHSDEFIIIPLDKLRQEGYNGNAMKKEFEKTKYTVACFDVDGTLIPHAEQIRPRVQHMLGVLRESGVKTVVSTGRDDLQMPPDLMQCFSYAVTCNGGCVTDISTGALIAGHPFQKSLLLEIMAELEAMTGECIIFRRGTMVGSPAALRMLFRKYPPGVKSWIPPKSGPLPGRPVPFPFMRALVRNSHKPVYKLKVYFRDISRLQEAYELIQKDNRLTVILMDGDDLEITLSGVTKATAISELCASLGCTQANVMAMGDSANDLEMLTAAGFAVVMGNGEDCVMDLADYVAPTVFEDGAAAAVAALYGLDV